MTDKMDLSSLERSLDDIIKMSGSERGGRSGSSLGQGSHNDPGWRDSGFGAIRRHRGGTRGNIRSSPYARPKELPERSRQHVKDGTRLVISNLHFKMSDSDIEELFVKFGPLRKSVVYYDSSGRSLGIADVVFVRLADALNSIEYYNNRLLDGRPMQIQLVTDFVNQSEPPQFGRITMIGYGVPKGRQGRRGREGKRKVTTVEDLMNTISTR